MGKPGLYLIRNSISRTIYVGHSANTEQRIRQHRHRLNSGTHNNPILQAAWSKYGASAFRFRHVANVTDSAERCALEMKLIGHLREQGRGLYNVGDGGEGQPHTPESRAKISAARTGMKFTAEHSRHMSEAQRGRKPSPAWRAKMEARNFGRGGKRGPMADETRRKLSESAKLRPRRKHSIESRLKMSRVQTGRTFTAETRERMREARLRCVATGHKTKARLITANGVTLSLVEWSAKTGIGRSTIAFRIDKAGWSPEMAVTTLTRKEAEHD